MVRFPPFPPLLRSYIHQSAMMRGRNHGNLNVSLTSTLRICCKSYLSIHLTSIDIPSTREEPFEREMYILESTPCGLQCMIERAIRKDNQTEGGVS